MDQLWVLPREWLRECELREQQLGWRLGSLLVAGKARKLGLLVERMEERKACYSGYRLTFSLFHHFDLQRGFLHWIELIEKDRL